MSTGLGPHSRLALRLSWQERAPTTRISIAVPVCGIIKTVSILERLRVALTLRLFDYQGYTDDPIP